MTNIAANTNNATGVITDLTQALDLIKSADDILIAPSTPDGDSIGSALALMLVLRRLDKKVTVISTNDLPDYLKFLPATHQIQKALEAGKDFVISLKTDGGEVDHLKYEVEQGVLKIIISQKSGKFQAQDVSCAEVSSAKFDLIITVDTGDLVQLGSLYEEHKDLFERGPLLNIDHHASNGLFGTHNLLRTDMASTTQMLTPLIMELERESGITLIDEDVATLLLVGLITDTGSFQHSNTSPEAFEVAADLLERGARQQEIIKQIFKTKSLATLKLWGRVLSKIQIENSLVYSSISLIDLSDTGAESEDSGGIIDELMSNAPDAKLVLLLKEKEAGFISGSLRALAEDIDVSQIAGELGGGGHKKAAGFRIRNKSMEEALLFVKSIISKYTNTGHTNTAQMPEEGTLFPGLVSRPSAVVPAAAATPKPQSSIPMPSEGGEDMLLQDFRSRQNTEQANIEKAGVKFFQDKDGQEAPITTVGDVLAQNPFAEVSL